MEQRAQATFLQVRRVLFSEAGRDGQNADLLHYIMLHRHQVACDFLDLTLLSVFGLHQHVGDYLPIVVFIFFGDIAAGQQNHQRALAAQQGADFTHIGAAARGL
ncbi:hypothetical protein D3C76_1551870 [compost metagenome]